jgi:hypothetical protein
VALEAYEILVVGSWLVRRKNGEGEGEGTEELEFPTSRKEIFQEQKPGKRLLQSRIYCAIHQRQPVYRDIGISLA